MVYDQATADESALLNVHQPQKKGRQEEVPNLIPDLNKAFTDIKGKPLYSFLSIYDGSEQQEHPGSS